MPRGLAVAVAALLFLQFAAAAAYAQAPPPGAINPRAVVKESIMRIYVYPDGSVQPYYKLVATIDLGSSINLYGKVLYESRSVLEQNTSTSSSSLVVDVQGPRVGKNGGLNASAEWRYRGLGGGSGDAVVSLVLSWWNATARERLVVKELRIEARGGEKATLYLDLLAPTRLLRDALREQGLAALTPDEINKRLHANNVDYIRVKSLSVTMLGNGTTEVKLVLEEDIARMIDQAVANGMPREDARELLNLLRSGARVTGSGELRLSVEAGGNHLAVRLETSSRDRGDLADAELLMQKAMPLLVEALTYLVKPYVEQNPEPALIIAQIQAGLQRGVTPVVRVAPSKSNTTARIEFRGRYVDVYVEYYGDRVRVPSREAPGLVAEKTLTLLSQQLSKALQSLGTLQAYVPGLAAAVPNRVELVPVDGVKLSQTRVTINQLPLVRVTVVAAPTRTATPTAPPAATTRTSTSQATTPAATSTGATRPTATAPPPPPAPTSTPTSTASPTAPATTTGAGAAAGAGGATVSAETALAVIVVTLAVVAAAAALLLRRGQA